MSAATSACAPSGVSWPGINIFHDIKQGDSGPASGAKDDLSVNPNTGEVFDANGEEIGNLNDGH